MILVGVASNICVVGRPFGLRNLVRYGKNAVLVRDLTDSMYNPARPPHVDHFTGTGLVVEHIEKYICPSVVSTDLTGEPPFRFKDDPRVQVWDVWNEPDNMNDNSYGKNKLKQEPEDKQALVLALLPKS